MTRRNTMFAAFTESRTRVVCVAPAAGLVLAVCLLGGWPAVAAPSAAVAVAAAASASAPAASGPLTLDDFDRIADVADPELSPDGEYLIYSVSAKDMAEDASYSDLWRVRWDGTDRRPLTQTPKESEWQPQWSQDGKWIAFLADRGGDDAKTQVWVMPAFGGEARQITRFAEGVKDFSWSPDGARFAVIAWDPQRPEGEAKPKNPPPIVTGRYQFKEDYTGYLTSRRRHLYVVDAASGQATLLTPGDHDEGAPAWSPDGKLVAYVTKRGAEGFQIMGILPGVLSPDSPGVGVAIKVSDGDLGQRKDDLTESSRVRSTVALEILRQLGALSPEQVQSLSKFGPVRTLKNHRGIITGQARPAFTLTLNG